MFDVSAGMALNNGARVMSDVILDVMCEPEWGELGFLDELDNMDTDYEVEKFDSDEDDGCEGGACKI
tara:strand:+ start:1324 stop:1524 length:201 start_codon:yes stop_codon:yes gene_type:complete